MILLAFFIFALIAVCAGSGYFGVLVRCGVVGLVCVKVQRETLAESSVVFGRVFGNKMGRRLTVVEEGLFSGIATSTVQVSYTRYTFTCSQ